MTEVDDYRALANFLGSYLNQDFVEEYGSPDAAIDAFREEATAEEVRRLAQQARALRRDVASDDELWSTMRRMGIGYFLRGDGWKEHAWLEHLEHRVTEDR